ncbi:pentapeptide repeat-containing protein [Pseudoalteromonas sp. R3]|uniref:pentapeptide repeat-containing protein n=1 Tax=Pseudoalteromonas sp. R3 TaxID=1709477 RepID=UPI000FDD357C|nr:pentapeptide repeat-containing protein [Pseudoalteromonas sp. R3]AZZ96233.1 hypothetical protein ELR70_03275 [Pseudoalteromonas sp. R3]
MEKELERKLTGLPDKVTKLEGDDAILLWLKGKDAWNKWMEEHPGSSITFTDIDFSPEFIKARLASYNQLPELLEWSKSKQLISFEEYQFHGNVYFDNVKFYSDVSFEGAIFRDELIFFDSKFYSDVDFSRAVFCGSHTLFHNVEFLKDAKFVFSRFESLTDFLNVKFSTASFFSATFEGNSAFQEIEIKGKAVFTDAFFERKVDFRLRSFLGELLFNNATFEGACSISSSCDNKALLTSTRRLTFQGADFRRWLKIDGYFTCIPDMRATKTGHHVDLSGLRVMLRRGFVQEGWGVEKAIDPADSERLCRLKELAESNKDHKRALEFHAAESTARRWGI